MAVLVLALRAAAMVIVTPCWTRRCDSVVMSASTGTWRKISGSSLRSAAVISGSAAFLAPPMGMVPESGFPPRMRILSITDLAGRPGEIAEGG